MTRSSSRTGALHAEHERTAALMEAAALRHPLGSALRASALAMADAATAKAELIRGLLRGGRA